MEGRNKLEWLNEGGLEQPRLASVEETYSNPRGSELLAERFNCASGTEGGAKSGSCGWCGGGGGSGLEGIRSREGGQELN